MSRLFRNFTFNPKDDILSGLTVALALVPEAVAFAFVAGVDPLVGLYGAFMMGLITAMFGGRPGMISGATGAMAVVMVHLVLLTVSVHWRCFEDCALITSMLRACRLMSAVLMRL